MKSIHCRKHFSQRNTFAALLLLFLLLRLLPAFAQQFSRHISIPVLQTLVAFQDAQFLPTLETLVFSSGILLIFAVIRRHFLLCVQWIALLIFSVFLLLWYPLYSVPGPMYNATVPQLTHAADLLIQHLNDSSTSGSLPNDLPAKASRFPSLMHRLGISGFASFCTGEAFYDPTLADCAVPFVAVHEHMHLTGIANEGAANIAAWRECMDLGGAYAESARIWGLRYIMGKLMQQSPASYARCINQMSPRTRLLYTACGGAYLPLERHSIPRSVFDFLGISASVQNYEILAAYLAAGAVQ